MINRVIMGDYNGKVFTCMLYNEEDFYVAQHYRDVNLDCKIMNNVLQISLRSFSRFGSTSSSS